MVKEKRKICSCKWGLYTIPPKVYRKQNICVSSYCPVHLSYTRTHAHTHSHTHACTHIHTHARYNQERANKKTIHFPTVAGRNHCTCLLTINTPCLASTHPHFLTAGCIPWHQYPTPYSTPLSPFWELLRALHIPPSPKRQNATGWIMGGSGIGLSCREDILCDCFNARCLRHSPLYPPCPCHPWDCPCPWRPAWAHLPWIGLARTLAASYVTWARPVVASSSSCRRRQASSSRRPCLRAPSGQDLRVSAPYQ